MPLKAGSSRKVISENISELTHHGSRPRSHKQIVAIALHDADKYAHRADGGGLANTKSGLQPSGNYIDPVTGFITYKGEAGPRIEYDVPSTHDYILMPQGTMDRTRRSLNANSRGDAYRAANKVQGDLDVPAFEGRRLMGADEWNRIGENTALDLDQAPYRIGSGDEYRGGGRAHRATGGMNTLGNTRPISAMAIHKPPHLSVLGQSGALPRHHLASGGGFYLNDYTPWQERSEARELANDAYHGAGLFGGSGAGRTDRLPRAVGVDSFVMPADVVSGLGEGNTLAGSKIFDAILSSGGPYGTPRPQSGSIRPLASGGHTGDGKSHVMVASGEYLYPREGLMNIGYRRRAAGKRNLRPDPKADLAEGHKWAREMVDKVRHHVKKFLRAAPKPKR